MDPFCTQADTGKHARKETGVIVQTFLVKLVKTSSIPLTAADFLIRYIYIMMLSCLFCIYGTRNLLKTISFFFGVKIEQSLYYCICPEAIFTGTRTGLSGAPFYSIIDHDKRNL